MKCFSVAPHWGAGGSPSMRREWIEIMTGGLFTAAIAVSLHAEGVD